jgi:hypothetical protein
VIFDNDQDGVYVTEICDLVHGDSGEGWYCVVKSETEDEALSIARDWRAVSAARVLQWPPQSSTER